MKIEKVFSIVLKKLGLKELKADDNGKFEFTDEQKAKLAHSWGKEFPEKFESAYNKVLQDEDLVKGLNEMSNTIEEADNKEIIELQERLAEREEMIAVLSEDSEPDAVATQIENSAKGIIDSIINMNHMHNKIAGQYLKGAFAVMAGDTISVDELKTEFGTYLSQTSFEILRMLTQGTQCEKFMTTKMAITEWRASKALITSVVQQFAPKWTPLGSSEFTPITIQNRRHKVNVPVTPNDVMDSYVAFLYDETLTPQEMPITKYIIEKLIVPQIIEDRELKLLGKGVYEALGTVTEGSAGQATGKSMDGFVTILKNLKAAGTSNINFIDLGTITDANIVEKMNEFVDGIDEIFQTKNMPIFCSLSRYKQYKRAYQALYPTTKNVDEKDDIIDFSNNRLIPLAAMAGEDVMFTTPKENFIRLRHKNEPTGKLFMQAENYDVKVFGEYWEGVGFAIQEAVFAYVPETDGSGSGSGS